MAGSVVIYILIPFALHINEVTIYLADSSYLSAHAF